MDKMNRHPAWWQLWLLLLVLGGLAVLDARASLSSAGHKLVEAGIVLLVYGLLWLWLRANEAVWLRELTSKDKDA